jgi:hypothetical protein
MVAQATGACPSIELASLAPSAQVTAVSHRPHQQNTTGLARSGLDGVRSKDIVGDEVPFEEAAAARHGTPRFDVWSLQVLR